MTAILVGLLGLIGVLVTIIVSVLPRAARNVASEQAIEVSERTANALRAELLDQERRYQDKIKDIQTKLDEMRGRAAVLTDGFATDVVNAAIEKRLPEAVAKQVSDRLARESRGSRGGDS